MREEVKKLLDIAKLILKENPNSCLTGSLMLYLRGISLDREPHDIDILILDYAPNIKLPKGMDFNECEFASDGNSIKYECNGVLVDVMSSSEQPEIIEGIPLATVDGLIKNKYSYFLKGDESSKKHEKDLIMLGFKFPEINSEIDLLF